MKPHFSFSRRDFLKLSASGALGLFLAETGLDHALALSEPPANHGRVLMSGLFMYEAPFVQQQTVESLRQGPGCPDL